MATTNVKKILTSVGTINPSAVAEVVAVSADDTAGYVEIDFSPYLLSVDTFIADTRDSNGLQKLLKVTITNQTVKIADDGTTTTVAANDVYRVIAVGNPK